MGKHLLSRYCGRRSPARALPALLAVIVGGAAIFAPAAAPARSPHSSSTATTARAMSVDLVAALRLIGRPGHVSNERGTISGTFPGTVAVRFVAIGSSEGTSTFTIYPSSGGSISGQSTAHGRVEGATATFSGSATITGGTGRWAHASGSGLQYNGTLDRQNNHATSTMRGTIHL